MSKASPARLLALKVTRLVRERKAYAHDLIEKFVYPAPLPQNERDFATLLVLGVIATAGELDFLLKRALTKGGIKPDVRDALRISVYELIFLKKEAYIAVDQGVELVRSFSPQATGFANKVLHNIVKLEEQFPFGDPQSDTAALAHQNAFPLWLAERLIEDLNYDEGALFMHASNLSAPLFLADLECGTPLEIGSTALFEYLHQDRYIVADASAQRVAQLATPPADGAFLEVGSGRGTKTVLLQHNALRTHGRQAEFYALDNHAFKNRILAERIERYRLTNVTPVTGDATRIAELVEAGEVSGSFAGALIDAPCSGTGTLRRHPEIRWRLRPRDITAMAVQGLALLAEAARYIAPGGFVVYSTCSVFSEENEAVINAFLSSSEGRHFALEPTDGAPYFRSSLAPGSPDAHFAARLVRTRK